LHGALETARAEIKRAMREEVVVLGPGA
jgi:hypothetical protein